MSIPSCPKCGSWLKRCKKCGNIFCTACQIRANGGNVRTYCPVCGNVWLETPNM